MNGRRAPFLCGMHQPITRRSLLGLAGAWIAGGCARPPASPPPAPAGPEELSRIERRVGGRVGLFAVEARSGQRLEHRADERFAMCSTFKWALAAAVLTSVDRGELALDRAIRFGKADLQEYAPVTRSQVAAGHMSIEALARAAVTVSDNTAANLLLAQIGGPDGLTRFFREQGDPVTRLDRIEPMLNTNEPGDPRDTTSPRAMACTLRRVLTENVLTPGSRDRLLGWLVAAETGASRLRAGLPAGWRAGDKTGTGNHGACGDVAIFWSPTGTTWFVAAYLSGSSAPLAELNAAHADIARLVAGSA